MSEAKFMRIIVFFDLPVTTAAKRKAANQFRQFLLKDGYQMLQLSVYSRIVKGRDSLQKHHNRLCANLPQEGSIRCLEVTEKQYATMKLLLGELKTQEKRVNSDQLRPLQNSFFPDSRNLNTGFRLFLFQRSTDSTQISP